MSNFALAFAHPAAHPRDMRTTIDTLIIGAGVVGCSTALALARSGYRTLNLDALPAPGYGSTSHSSAIVRPFYSHVTSCAIAHEARHHWLSWADFIGEGVTDSLAEYRETGGFVLVRAGTEDAYRENLAALDAVGVDYAWLDKQEIRARFPGIELSAYGPPRRPDDPAFGQPSDGTIGSAIYIPACGHVSDPQQAARNLADAATLSGARFRYGTTVAEIVTSSGRVRGVVLDSGETIHCDTLINAAGPHSARVNALAGLTLPIGTTPHRHEVAYLRAPAADAREQGFVVDLDTGVYRRGDGVDWLIGTTDPECDGENVVDPDTYSDQLSEQWTAQVYRAALRFPELALENQARGTVGLYDVSEDWIPIYDVTELAGYYVGIGTSGNQFKNAPLIGAIMKAIIEADNHDAEPAELHLAHLDRTVSLDFYSRNRTRQRTNSVLA